MSLLSRLRADAIAWEDGFLAEDACARLVDELRFAYWRPSTVINRSRNGDVVAFDSDSRQSESTTEDWFTADARRELRAIERRVCRRLKVERDRLEPWQATRYRRGGRFEPHNDAGLFGHEPAGERTITLLLYLQAPGQGGATRFPALDIELSPRPGRLVVWENLDRAGKVDPFMSHTSLRVGRGSKTTLTTWCRERAIR
jgi:hypothetical protein